MFMVGCSNKVDETALQHIVNGLESRWEYTDSLTEEEISISHFKQAIETELDGLVKYDSDNFKNTNLYVLYSDYRKELENGLFILEHTELSDEDLGNDWTSHLVNRAEKLKRLSEEFDLKVSSEFEDELQHVIDYADELTKEDHYTELSDIEIMNFMEQITFRYYNASKHDNDSFEQRSELQACLGRVESLTAELKEKYPDDNLSLLIIDLGKDVEKACQDKLEGKHDSDYVNSYTIGEHVGFISETFMDG